MNDLITQPGSNAVALPADYMAALALEATNASSLETPSVSNLSFKSGILAVGGNPVPGNAMNCVVVLTAHERCYYEGAYDPNKIKNPVCFVISQDGEDTTPHDNSTKPQHTSCTGCPKNEWGSVGEGRKGKACKEIRRLALIPTDKLQSPDDILASEMVLAKIPVTSVNNWSNHVHKVSALHSMPYWAVVTKLSVKPHIKNQFEVCFDIAGQIGDMPALEALKTKRVLAGPFVGAPYDGAPEAEAPADEAKPAKTSKKF